jgi:hypothetical protein
VRDRGVRVLAAAGLAAGGVFGMAGTLDLYFATSPNPIQRRFAGWGMMMDMMPMGCSLPAP